MICVHICRGGSKFFETCQRLFFVTNSQKIIIAPKLKMKRLFPSVQQRDRILRTRVSAMFFAIVTSTFVLQVVVCLQNQDEVFVCFL